MLKFDNGTKDLILKDHTAIQDEVTKIKEMFTTIKNSLNTEIRTAVNEESMAGEYAKALDSECTEIMADISSFESILDAALTEVKTNITKINEGEIYKDTTAQEYLDGPTMNIVNEVVTGAHQAREDQNISVSDALAIESVVVPAKKAEGIEVQKPDTIIKKTYNAKSVEITGYNSNSYIVYRKDGTIIILR